MMPIKRVVVKAGGRRELARKLGFPVTSFLIRIWERCNEIPESYRYDVARLAGCSIADLTPEFRPEKPRHAQLGVIYVWFLRQTGLSVRQAARLHDVPQDTIREWMRGTIEPPPSAFVQFHDLVSGRRPLMDMTVASACESLNTSQAELARRCGVTAPAVCKWKKAGRIPDKYARLIAGFVREKRK